MLSTLRYTAFGEVRAASGATATDYRYTGQRSEAEIGLYFYVARFYDPILGRFVSADTYVPESQGVQAWDRYAFVNNNPVRYTDPTGHNIPFPQLFNFSNIYIPLSGGWDLVGAAACAVFCGVLPVHFESYGLGQGAIVGDSPAQTMEKGMTLFGAGVLGANLSAQVSAPATEKPQVNTRPVSRTPNEIGAWGEQQVGENLPVNVQQQRVFDPNTGQTRIYDGNFNYNQAAYVEVKTSTRNTIYANQSIRNQVAFDTNFGANSGTMPTWIFVNAQPSRPLLNLLQQSRIPWHQLHVPQ